MKLILLAFTQRALLWPCLYHGVFPKWSEDSGPICSGLTDEGSLKQESLGAQGRRLAEKIGKKILLYHYKYADVEIGKLRVSYTQKFGFD